MNRKHATQDGVEGLVGMARLGVHENSTKTVTQLDTEADGEHVRDVRVDIGDSGILVGSFSDSSFAFLLVLTVCRYLRAPLKVSGQANAKLQHL